MLIVKTKQTGVCNESVLYPTCISRLFAKTEFFFVEIKRNCDFYAYFNGNACKYIDYKLSIDSS